MTKRQLLENTDSMELTKWFAYFDAKSEREEADRKDREWKAQFKGM